MKDTWLFIVERLFFTLIGICIGVLFFTGPAKAEVAPIEYRIVE